MDQKLYYELFYTVLRIYHLLDLANYYTAFLNAATNDSHIISL